MTDRAEIERLLNQTGRTLEGLPEFYPEEEQEAIFKKVAREHSRLWENVVLHQSDVIELLVGALRDALEEAEKQKTLAEMNRILLEKAGKLMPKWISVEERLPQPFVSVLVHMPGEIPHQTVREGYISSEGIWVAGYFRRESDEVTHWAEMPEPPEE